MLLAVNISVFLVLQIVAALLFKWGSLAPHLYWWGFSLGNVFGMTSIIFLINVYKVMNPNLTLAICTGGAFLLNQIAMTICFKTPMNIMSGVGAAMILFGIVVMAVFKTA